MTPLLIASIGGALLFFLAGVFLTKSKSDGTVPLARGVELERELEETRSQMAQTQLQLAAAKQKLTEGGGTVQDPRVLQQVEALRGELEKAEREKIELREQIAAKEEAAVAALDAGATAVDAAISEEHTAMVAAEQQRARADALEQRVEELEAENQTKQKEFESQLARLKSAPQGDRSLENRLKQEQAKQAELKKRLGKMNELQKQNEELKTRVKDLSKDDASAKLADVLKERDALKIEIGHLKQRVKAAQKVGDEKADLAANLKELMAEREDLEDQLAELEEISEQRADLALKVDQLQKQLAEVNTLREDNAKMKATIDEVADMRNQIKALSEENADLKSKKLVATKNAPPKLEISDSQKKTIGSLLQELLNKLSQHDNARGAVLADESGLVVAGTGEHADALAAISAVFGDVASRVNKNLPLSKLKLLAVEDDNDVTFATQPLSVEQMELTLATLTVGAPPRLDTLQGIIEQLGK